MKDGRVVTYSLQLSCRDEEDDNANQVPTSIVATVDTIRNGENVAYSIFHDGSFGNGALDGIVDRWSESRFEDGKVIPAPSLNRGQAQSIYETITNRILRKTKKGKPKPGVWDLIY